MKPLLFLTNHVPPERVGIFFGLFTIAGTATMWLGPLLVQGATEASGSQRVGLLNQLINR